MNILEFTDRMNRWGQEQVPFLFAVDFEMEKPWIIRLDDIHPQELKFDIRGFSNVKNETPRANGVTTLQKQPISLTAYEQMFDVVYKALSYGDSYLTNLTVKTEIQSVDLEEVFLKSKAAYKLLYQNKILVFSPETFIQIRDGRIFSYPMKGTIDATIENARQKILDDQKELAEHVTIVDLIRNDLSQVADNVSVSKFRFIDEIHTNDKNLLQVSSEIQGILPPDYQQHIGDILIKLLPAGSVSGAPKNKTVEIIRRAENEKRGFYTGVFGYFNGLSLDSGVMIRFIEKEGEKYFYRSGGGITTQSVVLMEYQEAIDKVYVPVD
jgi:para-aminobenzoate synthetase component 1